MGIRFFHETLCERSRIERRFRKLRRGRRSSSNPNPKSSEAIEEIAKAIAPIHSKKTGSWRCIACLTGLLVRLGFISLLSRHKGGLLDRE